MGLWYACAAPLSPKGEARPRMVDNLKAINNIKALKFITWIEESNNAHMNIQIY